MTSGEILSILEQYPHDTPVELGFLDEALLEDPEIRKLQQELMRRIEEALLKKKGEKVKAIVLYDVGSVRFDKTRLIFLEDLTHRALEKDQRDHLRSVS